MVYDPKYQKYDLPRAEPKAAPMQMALTTRPSNAGVKFSWSGSAIYGSAPFITPVS